MPTEAGYSNQKKKGSSQFKTIHNVGSSQHGAPIAQKTLFDVTPIAQPIVSVTDIVGIDGQVEFWNIEITGHTATVNNVLRMITGTLLAWEYNIVRVIDADNFYILPISETRPLVAETAKIMGWITTRSDAQGSQTVTSGPITYLLDAATTTVSQDTVVPASSRPLPTRELNPDGTVYDHGTQFQRNGSSQRVILDTVTPSNSVGLPSVTLNPDGTVFDNVNQFQRNGVSQKIILDTVTPSNSRPSPAIILDSTGVPVDWAALIKTNVPLATIVVDYFTTPVTDAAYVELIATVGATPVKKVQIFSATGTSLYLAFGAAASEVDSFIIIPGGNGVVDLDIPAGTRLSAKAIIAGQTASGTTLGDSLLLINLLG